MGVPLLGVPRISLDFMHQSCWLANRLIRPRVARKLHFMGPHEMLLEDTSEQQSGVGFLFGWEPKGTLVVNNPLIRPAISWG